MRRPRPTRSSVGLPQRRVSTTITADTNTTDTTDTNTSDTNTTNTTDTTDTITKQVIKLVTVSESSLVKAVINLEAYYDF